MQVLMNSRLFFNVKKTKKKTYYLKKTELLWLFSYRFAMLFYTEHVHLQSISVILQFSTVFQKHREKTVQNTEKYCKITVFFLQCREYRLRKISLFSE